MNKFVSPYKVRIEPSGRTPYELDLSEFALGGSVATVGKTTSWGGNYRGRPKLAAELAELWTLDAPIENSASSQRSAMRGFFRFLDRRQDEYGEAVASIADVTDAHGPAFRAWLDSDTALYKLVKTMLNKMRALNGCRQLFWPARRPDALRQVDHIEEEPVRKLFHALRHEARAIKANFAEGERLAVAGSDPRGQGPAAFLVPENRAWLLRELLRTRGVLDGGLPDRKALIAMGARRFFVGPGAPNLAPGLSPKYAGGFAGAARWFAPAYADIVVFFYLFLLGTGWNTSTACAIDVSSDEGWWQPHPQSEIFAVLHAWKNRADKHQFAISMRKPEWHPFRVLEYVVERTAPLRAIVVAKLGQLREKHAAAPTDSLAAEIERHEQLSRTPWLFVSFEQTGAISGIIADTDASWLNKFVRATINRHGLDVRYPRLSTFTSSDARDAWIGYAYVHSGYNLLLTRLASQHASLRILRHYLRATRYRRHSEKQISKLQHALFSEIEAGRPVDPVRLRLLVENGQITVEQEKRLADRRARTRLGMGCLDPRSPPKRIAPDHAQGSLCRVQRCIGCSNGIVFQESMPALARALAELRHVRRTMPAASWDGSSFEAEHDGLQLTLKNFDAAEVAAEIHAWSEKLRKGEVQAHVVYPSY